MDNQILFGIFHSVSQFRRFLREMKENRLKMGARRVNEFPTGRKLRLSFVLLESFFMLPGTWIGEMDENSEKYKGQKVKTPPNS